MIDQQLGLIKKGYVSSTRSPVGLRDWLHMEKPDKLTIKQQESTSHQFTSAAEVQTQKKWLE